MVIGLGKAEENRLLVLIVVDGVQDFRTHKGSELAHVDGQTVPDGGNIADVSLLNVFDDFLLPANGLEGVIGVGSRAVDQIDAVAQAIGVTDGPVKNYFCQIELKAVVSGVEPAKIDNAALGIV